MYKPNDSNFLIWWPAWRIGNEVIIQNQLLFFEELVEKLDESNFYIHVGKRGTESENGQKISEWHIGIEDIRKFINSIEESSKT